jgi:hypothetical protein
VSSTENMLPSLTCSGVSPTAAAMASLYVMLCFMMKSGDVPRNSAFNSTTTKPVSQAIIRKDWTYVQSCHFPVPATYYLVNYSPMVVVGRPFEDGVSELSLSVSELEQRLGEKLGQMRACNTARYR